METSLISFVLLLVKSITIVIVYKVNIDIILEPNFCHFLVLFFSLPFTLPFSFSPSNIIVDENERFFRRTRVGLSIVVRTIEFIRLYIVVFY